MVVDGIRVARLLDYAQHQYESRRREREKEKKQRADTVVKEVRVGLRAGPNDVKTSITKIRTFLKQNIKVKVRIHVHRKHRSEAQQMAPQRLKEVFAGLGEMPYTIADLRAVDVLDVGATIDPKPPPGYVAGSTIPLPVIPEHIHMATPEEDEATARAKRRADEEVPSASSEGEEDEDDDEDKEGEAEEEKGEEDQEDEDQRARPAPQRQRQRGRPRREEEEEPLQQERRSSHPAPSFSSRFNSSRG